LKHMWGATLATPKYRESAIVSLVDDYEAVHEFFGPTRKHVQAFVEKLTPNA